jgi:hypothetical protein
MFLGGDKLGLQSGYVVHGAPPALLLSPLLLACSTARFAVASVISLVEAIASAAVHQILLFAPCMVTNGLSRQPHGSPVRATTGLINATVPGNGSVVRFKRNAPSACFVRV